MSPRGLHFIRPESPTLCIRSDPLRPPEPASAKGYDRWMPCSSRCSYWCCGDTRRRNPSGRKPPPARRQPPQVASLPTYRSATGGSSRRRWRAAIPDPVSTVTQRGMLLGGFTVISRRTSLSNCAFQIVRWQSEDDALTLAAPVERHHQSRLVLGAPEPLDPEAEGAVPSSGRSAAVPQHGRAQVSRSGSRRRRATRPARQDAKPAGPARWPYSLGRRDRSKLDPDQDLPRCDEPEPDALA